MTFIEIRDLISEISSVSQQVSPRSPNLRNRMISSILLPLLLLLLSFRLHTTNANIHTVHVVFTHHLDIGLNEALRFVGFCEGFATKIIQEYFDDFIPRAISLAQEINGDLQNNNDNNNNDNGRFAYTIHPWIASLYVDCVPWDIQDSCPLNPGKLKCPDASKVAAFDAAVRRGDLLWADSPFNIDAGVAGEPGMFEALFDIGEALNERYNITKQSRVWSNVDVPGFARSSIPLLKKAGATALSICANVGNTHGESGSVPLEFVRNNNATMWRWHDPVSDEEILVLYHKAQRDTSSKIPLRSEFNTYGGYTRRDNMITTTKSGIALASFIAADNTGPPTSKKEVEAIFAAVQEIYPNATKIFGSTWDQFVAGIDPAEIEALPRFSSAWGDQWVAGMTSDPARISKYRAIIRARARCIKSGLCHTKDPVLRNFTRFASKNSEHTQGVEGGGNEPGAQLCIWLSLLHLPCKADKYWKNVNFETVHNNKKNIFPGADDSWLEDRLFNTLAIEGVPTSHPLSNFLKEELNALSSAGKTLANEDKESIQSMQLRASSSSSLMLTAANKTTVVSCNGTELHFSNETGSLVELKFGHGGSSWSRLMDYRYLTYHMSDHHGAVCNESTCPNPIAGAWSPHLLNIHVDPVQACRVTVEAGFNSTLHNEYGAPSTVSFVYDIDPMYSKMNVTLTWHNKTTTRLSEATTIFHRPTMRKGYAWEMDKLGEWVAAANVTQGGNQYQHAVWSGIRYVEMSSAAVKKKGLFINTLDAGLVCPVLNQVADPALTSEMSLFKSCDKYNIKDPKDLHYQRQLTNEMISGFGLHLHGNLFDISGFPQWYPFGVGDRYQEEDATEQFRFVFEER